MNLPNLDAIRRSIPALSESIFMNTAGIGPTPRPVLDRITREFTDIARHGPPSLMDPKGSGERAAETRGRIARFFGVTPEEVCFTQGVSDGFGIVGNGFDWRPGDEMIITDEEHPAFETLALHLARRRGIVVRRLTLSDDPEAMLSGLKGLLTGRTRLVALSHVATDTGTRVPEKAICDLCHEYDIPVAFDGAQAAGQFPVDLRAMGADFYCVLSYKWLLGPYGAGCLYVRREQIEKLEVTMAGARTPRRIDRQSGAYAFQPSALRFECGPAPMPLFHGFSETLDFIDGVGTGQIHTLGAAHAAHLREGLGKTRGVTVQSPSGPDTSTAIVAFTVEGKPGGDVTAALRAKGIVQRATGLKFSGVRIAPAFFSTDAEIEKVIEAVREIART